MAERARGFESRLSGEFDIRLAFRQGNTIGATSRLLFELFAFGPAACYVFDMAAAGVAAAGLYCIATRRPMVVDTGDSIVALALALGRSRLGVLATRALEACALRLAARVVVRGSSHQEILAKHGVQTVFVPDGVDMSQFACDAPPALDAGRPLVIGLVGSALWVPARQTCYGWELIELVRLLKDRLANREVRGVFIGNGSGIAMLRRRCEALAIADRIEFVGNVPYIDLPRWLGQFDICLSTQTDDEIGRVRTTGKLPLYLATGRFVLASRVGEAARILPPPMLVKFQGSVDPQYPSRLADRVMELLAQRTDFSHRPECVMLAREHFDYDRLAPRVSKVIFEVLTRKRVPFGRRHNE